MNNGKVKRWIFVPDRKRHTTFVVTADSEPAARLKVAKYLKWDLAYVMRLYRAVRYGDTVELGIGDES